MNIDLHIVEDFQKSESHPASDDQFVHFVQHILYQLNFVRNFRSVNISRFHAGR